MLCDLDTGASPKHDAVRPCVVVAVASAIVVVAPRSASVKGLLPTPADASTAFDKPGSFSRWRCRVSRTTAEEATNHGALAEPYLRELLAMVRRRTG